MNHSSFMPADIGALFQTRFKFFLPEILGTTASTGAATVALLPQVQQVVSILAGLTGFIAGLLTIRSLLKKERELKRGNT